MKKYYFTLNDFLFDKNKSIDVVLGDSVSFIINIDTSEITSASLNAYLPDGSGLSTQTGIEIGRDRISVTLDSRITSLIGSAKLDITLYKENMQASCFPITLNVHQSVLCDDYVESEALDYMVNALKISSKAPYIESGYWMEYDNESGAFVSTNVKATGLKYRPSFINGCLFFTISDSEDDIAPFDIVSAVLEAMPNGDEISY